MDVDNNMLISEVARQRMMSTGDTEAEAFIRRQGNQMRSESGYTYRGQQQPQQPLQEETAAGFGQTPLSASLQTLEREIIYYLLKYGQSNYTTLEGGTVVEFNTATEIVSSLDRDYLQLTTPVYQTIIEIYRQELTEGRFPLQSQIVNHHDPEVCSTAVDILTMDDNYVESAIWSQKDMRSLNESQMLSAGIPKLMMLYKSRLVSSHIEEVNRKLATAAENSPEAEQALRELAQLNKLKVSLSNHLKRTII